MLILEYYKIHIGTHSAKQHEPRVTTHVFSLTETYTSILGLLRGMDQM
jgi:hypothetical protein